MGETPSNAFAEGLLDGKPLAAVLGNSDHPKPATCAGLDKLRTFQKSLDRHVRAIVDDQNRKRGQNQALERDSFNRAGIIEGGNANDKTLDHEGESASLIRRWTS